MSQIAVMQVIFYLVSSAIWLFIAMLTGRTFSADTLFSWEVAVRPHPHRLLTALCSAHTQQTTKDQTSQLQVEGADADEEDEARGAGGGRQESWVVGILAALAVAAVCGLTLVPVVGRAKQCWDFAATVYILHLLACSCYTRFPIVIQSHPIAFVLARYCPSQSVPLLVLPNGFNTVRITAGTRSWWMVGTTSNCCDRDVTDWRVLLYEVRAPGDIRRCTSRHRCAFMR